MRDTSITYKVKLKKIHKSIHELVLFRVTPLIYHLYHKYHVTYREIAEVLNISKQAVQFIWPKSRLIEDEENEKDN